MNHDDVIKYIHKATLEPNKGWWFNAAYKCILNQDYFFIESRKTQEVYMARFWLSQPKRIDDGFWNSGDSVLLHFIIVDDDQEALHDHPWDFRTQILNGGYTENLPTEDWHEKLCWDYTSLTNEECRAYSFEGPEPGNEHQKITGDVIYHKATDLHRAVDVLPETWTLVTTDNKSRKWGFWPEGEKWQYYRDYLELDNA